MEQIIERDFRGVDLNLLLIFHVLMQERSVTAAARRLFLGQPAVSGSLKRLRALFQDPLLLRSRRGMRPTPRALELSRRIEPLLGSLHQLLTHPAEFHPGTVERTFRVGMSDALEVALMPELMSRVARLAPGVRIISRFTEHAQVSRMLEAGEIELAIGVFPEVQTWQRQDALFRWRFICVFDPRRIKLKSRKLTLKDYLRHPHVMTSFTGDLRGYIDERLELIGERRRVIYSSPNFATSPLLVSQMAAFTTVPSFISHIWRERVKLDTRPLPFPVPDHQVSLLWSRAHDQDPGLRWLRREILAAFKKERAFDF